MPLFRQILAFDPVDTYRGIILPQAFAPAMVLILKGFFDHSGRADGLQEAKNLASAILAALPLIVDFLFSKANHHGNATTGFGRQ